MTIAIILSSVLSALVLAVALVLPSINSPTVPFGVRVPVHHADDPTVLRQTRIYRWRVAASWIVAAAVGVALYSLTGETLTLSLSVLLLVGLWYGCFFLANREIRAAKAAGDWYPVWRRPSSSAADRTSIRRTRPAPRAGTATTWRWAPRPCSGWPR